MKTPATLVAFALAATAFAQQPNPALTASAEQRKLDLWIGDWTYEFVSEESPVGPAGLSVGLNTVRPILDGKFVEFRGEDTGPQGTRYRTETGGYDPASRRYRWSGFASDGSTQDVSYENLGSRFPYSGTMTVGATQYRIRGTLAFSDDGSASTDRREISADGRAWKPLWERRASRLKAAIAMPMGDTHAHELELLEQQWARASRSGDVGALDQLLAEEAVIGLPEGRWQTKAEYLRACKSGVAIAASELTSGVATDLNGDVAVVTGRTTAVEGNLKSGEGDRYVWTDTWVRRDGRWQCVAARSLKPSQK